MQERQTRDFLIRNMPVEVYQLLEQAAREHHRSKTKEAILALTKGLSMYGRHQLKKPKPFKWKTNISSQFIKEAIEEGRE